MGTMTLRKRLGMLRGVYAELMPYRDPHTTGPALWALYHQTGDDFEVSVVPGEGPTPCCKGLEALALALYRQEHGSSPTIEFGRMSSGYHASSSYNRRLLLPGRVFRGRPSEETDASHVPGIPPTSPLTGDPHTGYWGGHEWIPWIPLTDIAAYRPQGSGLYRIRGRETVSLLYIGQGIITSRLLAHLPNTGIPGHPQGQLFAAAGPLECSWVVRDKWLPHQRLELENDLIASNLLVTDDIPVAQFQG
jgi:hypothetical protein